jgi:hypothetical protein
VFLFFSSFQDHVPLTAVHIGSGDVSDSFVIPPVIVELDELSDRPPQLPSGQPGPRGSGNLIAIEG